MMRWIWKAVAQVTRKRYAIVRFANGNHGVMEYYWWGPRRYLDPLDGVFGSRCFAERRTVEMRQLVEYRDQAIAREDQRVGMAGLPKRKILTEHEVVAALAAERLQPKQIVQNSPHVPEVGRPQSGSHTHALLEELQ